MRAFWTIATLLLSAHPPRRRTAFRSEPLWPLHHAGNAHLERRRQVRVATG